MVDISLFALFSSCTLFVQFSGSRHLTLLTGTLYMMLQILFLKCNSGRTLKNNFVKNVYLTHSVRYWSYNAYKVEVYDWNRTNKSCLLYFLSFLVYLSQIWPQFISSVQYSVFIKNSRLQIVEKLSYLTFGRKFHFNHIEPLLKLF